MIIGMRYLRKRPSLKYYRYKTGDHKESKTYIYKYILRDFYGSGDWYLYHKNLNKWLSTSHNKNVPKQFQEITEQEAFIEVL